MKKAPGVSAHLAVFIIVCAILAACSPNAQTMADYSGWWEYESAVPGDDEAPLFYYIEIPEEGGRITCYDEDGEVVDSGSLRNGSKITMRLNNYGEIPLNPPRTESDDRYLTAVDPQDGWFIDSWFNFRYIGSTPFMTAEGTPNVYVAEGSFSLGGFLPPDESLGRHSWEIEYGNFPYMDGSELLAPAAEAMAQSLLNPEGEIETPLTRFSHEASATERFLYRETESSGVLYDDNTPVYLEAATPNLLLLANFTSEDEAYLESEGEAIVAEEFSREALVFITHADNPVESLTVEQLRGVLSGEIVNWSEIGGDNADIRLYYDFERMGPEIERLLHSLVMEGASLTGPVMGEQVIPSGIPGGDSYTLSYPEAYQNGPDSIGIAFLSDTAQPDVKPLAIDGVPPIAEAILAGEYPLCIGCFAVYRESDKDGVPAQFTEWMLGGKGAAVLEAAGIVPLGDAAER